MNPRRTLDIITAVIILCLAGFLMHEPAHAMDEDLCLLMQLSGDPALMDAAAGCRGGTSGGYPYRSDRDRALEAQQRRYNQLMYQRALREQRQSRERIQFPNNGIGSTCAWHGDQFICTQY